MNLLVTETWLLFCVLVKRIFTTQAKEEYSKKVVCTFSNVWKTSRGNLTGRELLSLFTIHDYSFR